MKKEIIIAVFAGIILGLIITWGIYTANRSLNQQQAKKLQQNPPSPEQTPYIQRKTINLTSHENFDLTDQAEINLNGVAWPEAIIALITESDTQLLQTDKQGVFNFSSGLIKGFNEISLIATDPGGSSQTQNLVLTYSTSQIELDNNQGRQLITPVFAQETPAKTASESVTEKIKERLQNTAEEQLISIKEEITAKSASPRKKAYPGRLVQIDDTSLTLIYKDQTFTINTDKDTTYTAGAANDIDRNDLKPNDFIIAMGFYFADKNEFLAKKVSRISAPEPPVNRQLISGKISEIDGQKITVAGKSLTLTKKTQLQIKGIDESSATDLSLDDYLVAIVTLDTNGNITTTNSVFVIPGKNNPAGLIPTNAPAEASGSAE